MPGASSPEKPANTHQRKGRWFWEPPAKLKKSLGLKSRPLGADQSAAWAVARRLNQELEEMRQGGTPPGTILWLFDKFFETDKFNGLARSTQMDYRWLAKCICSLEVSGELIGNMTAAVIRPRHADHIFSDLSKKHSHSAAHYCARFARRVWNWGGRKEYVGRDNPWAGMELKGLRERDEVWEPEQIQDVIAEAKKSEWPSIALAIQIAYAFGHRRSDILSLTWGALDSEIRSTSKTGVSLPVVVEVYPELAAALTEERQRQSKIFTLSLLVVQCELNGSGWQTDVFSHKFREIADRAGLPSKLQFRDIRATVQTELKDAGADVIDMSTHSGHKTVTMARRYARRTKKQFEHAASLRQSGRNK